jgi:diguanylate cyclase (GGDEF)-like protein
MSLIRQIWLLLVGMVLLAFLGSFLVWMMSSRSNLETQLRMKNSDAAQSLALTLSQQHGDPALMELVIAAQFDTGHYRDIRLVDPQGKVRLSRVADPAASNDPAVPQWFVHLVTVDATPGIAQVTDGWRPLGQLEVSSQSGFVYSQLWYGSLQTALWLSALGLLAGGVATWGVRRIRKPLDATIDQAQALVERRFVTVKEPREPELARLSRAMNTMVLRLKTMFDEQAAQVEQLRLQAHCDPLTGVSHRNYFLSQLATALARGDAAQQGGLLLVRVRELSEVNRRLGHRRTDHLLHALAQDLSTYRQGQVGEAVGRLNGSDFAFCLADGRLVSYLANSVCQSMRAICQGADDLTSVVVAGVTWRTGMQANQLLALADERLARAESRGPFAVESQDDLPVVRAVRGEDDWRRQIAQAIEGRRVQAQGHALLDRQRRVIHEEQVLQLQLDPESGYEYPSYWKPLAQRTGQLVVIDELAVELALEHIGRDGHPRAVSVSPVSLTDIAFVSRLRVLLSDRADHAAKLSLDIVESAAVERFELVRELCQQLHPLGVRLGLEHAGERLARIEQLFEAGLDYIKLDGAVVHGVSEEPSRLAHVKGLVQMLHSLGLQVYAESVLSDADERVLWECGLDGLKRSSDYAG